MKALVKSKSGRGLWLDEVPEPEPGINDVKVRVLYTGICGTDLHIYEWDDWAKSTIPVPMVIGHEFVGEIVSVGANVSDFHPGELVRNVRTHRQDRKSTRLNSSHVSISYAVFCLKKKKTKCNT